jgi:alanine racemase
VPVPVHVKVDTGMHRVGVAPPDAASLLKDVAAEPSLELAGVYTHLAVADGTGEEDRAFTRLQLERFEAVVDGLGASDLPRPMLHAANSAGALAWPQARYDMVRCGIACYGVSPSAEIAATYPAVAGLRPALSLHARVSAVRRLGAGDRPSYGRRRPLPDSCLVATVPLGYADGVPRSLFAAGAEVLIGGRRLPIAGTITMDQLMVDCGPDWSVAPGDEVVLLGTQGDETVTADEWAGRTGTIAYEVLCGIGPRVPRHYG